MLLSNLYALALIFLLLINSALFLKTMHHMSDYKQQGSLAVLKSEGFFLLNFDPDLKVPVLTGGKLYKSRRKNIAITYLSKKVTFICKKHVPRVGEA